MKKFLNVDRLELSYNLDYECKSKLESITELSFSNFTLIRKNNDSNYRNNFDIILGDSGLFGTLYFGSYNVNRQKIYISVDNRILYSNDLYRWSLELINEKIFRELDNLYHQPSPEPTDIL